MVHEAYLRLAARGTPLPRNTQELLLHAARAMKDVLIEHARRKSRIKRGGGRRRVALEDIPLVIDIPVDDLLALDAALERLHAEDSAGHRIVMLRYFAGLTVPEIAEALGVSVSTVERRWRFLRAWLGRGLAGDPGVRPRGG